MIHHPIIVMPQKLATEAAAMAVEVGGILQFNGKATVIAKTLLPGFVKFNLTEKK